MKSARLKMRETFQALADTNSSINFAFNKSNGSPISEVSTI